LTRLCYLGSLHRKQLNMTAKMTWHPWRITDSRTITGGKGSWGWKFWSGLQLPPGGGIEDSPDRVVAYAEQETESVPFSEHGAHGPVDGDLPRHQIGAWMIVEGRGNNRGKG
jgi:hypothetical protein